MFLESPHFPTDINYGLTGGPQYNTQLIEQLSGWEQANSLWNYPKHQYQLSYAVKDFSIVEKLLHFFHTVKGRAHGFRFKDPNDYKSSSITEEIRCNDQKMLGVVDGKNTLFQLAKTYSLGEGECILTTVRPIHKPVPDTVQVAIGGIIDKRWQCNYTHGQVFFMPDETAPITGLSYDAGKQRLSLAAANNLTAGDSVYLARMPELLELSERRFGIVAATPENIIISVPSLEQADALNAYTGNGCFHTLPQPDEIVTAGFEFDVPVRFASDSLSISSDSYQVSSIQQLGLVEIRI